MKGQAIVIAVGAAILAASVVCAGDVEQRNGISYVMRHGHLYMKYPGHFYKWYVEDHGDYTNCPTLTKMMNADAEGWGGKIWPQCPLPPPPHCAAGLFPCGFTDCIPHGTFCRKP